MKKLTVCTLIAALFTVAVSAYNPPVNGENYLELASPKYLTGASSVTGGAIFSAGPDSLLVNPALAAGEQRVVLNLADTFMLSSNALNSTKAGNAFQAGILIPSKMYIISGYANLTTVPFVEMNVGNSFNLRAGLSKEITEKLDVGLGLNTGLWWGNGSDWALSANLGFVYYWGNLSFMQNFRYGASIMNIGKGFQPSIPGENPDAKGNTEGFPSVFTVKLGCAASLFKNDILDCAYSLDFTIPAFQNFIIDMGLQFSLKNMLVLSVAEKINLVEARDGYSNFVPSIGLAFKFSFDVKNNEYLEKNDWSQSEMNVAAAYKNLYSTITAVSVGADVLLGMEDTSAPVFDESIFELEEE